MMPNSPSATTSAATLPLRNVAIENSRGSSRAGRPARPRWRDQSTNTISATTAIANATGTGERSNGQVQPPIVKGSSSCRR